MEKERGSKLYQDRIYGTKVLSPLAVAVLDTAEFQRLASLKQLGFTDQVYRGALHTRFEHSVGAYFMCRTMMRRIVQNHDRLDLPHPGRHISKTLATYPHDWISQELEEKIQKGKIPPSHQAPWRGLTEVVSVAALLHDLGHVPFSHTLEDEFTGIYRRHDSLAGHRLYEMMFNEASELVKVFSDDVHEPWIKAVGSAGISNQVLQRLIYVILSWKEGVEPPRSFLEILAEDKAKEKDPDRQKRLVELEKWYKDFSSSSLFHPFMSDIVGNTICADLMDYLPRDRQNLGMEWRLHHRLTRYFTIRKGGNFTRGGGILKKRVSDFL